MNQTGYQSLRDRHRLVTRMPAALLFAIVCGFAASNAGAAVTIDRVQLGVAGLFKVGLWCEAAVDVSVEQPRSLRLVLHAPDPEGYDVAYVGDDVELVAPGSHRLRLLFRVGRLESRLRIRVEDDTGVLASETINLTEDSERGPALKQSVFLLATIGGPAGFDRIETGEQSPGPDSTATANDNESYRFARLAGPDELPTTVAGLESLDALVIAGEYAVDEEQSRAVRDWVLTGGHLILSVGSRVAEYRSSPLAHWIPAPLPEESRIRDRELSGFESYSGKSERINVVGREAPCAVLGDVGGVVRVAGLTSQPLLVRIPYGLGLVTLFAVDLERPPLSEWNALGYVTRKVLAEGGFDPKRRERSTRARLTHAGITELASQLYTAQQQFPQVRRMSTWTIMGLLLAYIAVIGPLDYLVVHRLLKVPRLTWVTFPAMVLLAATLAAYGATATNGSALHVSQLDVIDVDAASGVTRCQSWFTVYSPESRRYEVHVGRPEMFAGEEPADSLAPVRLSWHGVAENMFGGMYRPGGLEIVRPAYQLSPEHATVQELPIPVWSTKSLMASRMDVSDALVDSELESTPLGQLQGTIEHHFPVPIEEPILAFGTQVYQPEQTKDDQIPKLMPDQRWFPATLSRRDLNGYLTDARARRVRSQQSALDAIVTEQGRYDRQSRNPTEILRTITFHGAAGGDEYTGLENNALRAMDVTRLLRTGRAVLFGKVQLNAAPIELNGERVEPSQQAAYVRIVLPVTVTGKLPTELPEIEGPRSQGRYDDAN